MPGDVLGEGSLWCAWGCTGRREFMVCLGMYWEKGVYGVPGDVLGEGSLWYAWGCTGRRELQTNHETDQ